MFDMVFRSLIFLFTSQYLDRHGFLLNIFFVHKTPIWIDDKIHASHLELNHACSAQNVNKKISLLKKLFTSVEKFNNFSGFKLKSIEINLLLCLAALFLTGTGPLLDCYKTNLLLSCLTVF